MKIKKRSSPSTMKRNAKRREDFFNKKCPPEAAVATGLESNQKQGNSFQCDQCDSTFKTENGLRIHKGRSHKEASSPEKMRKSLPPPSLIVSPIRAQDRVEACHNCGKDMSPTHLCEDDIDSTLRKPAPIYQPPSLKCDQCHMFFHWNDQSTLDLHIKLKHTNH